MVPSRLFGGKTLASSIFGDDHSFSTRSIFNLIDLPNVVLVRDVLFRKAIVGGWSEKKWK